MQDDINYENGMVKCNFNVKAVTKFNLVTIGTFMRIMLLACITLLGISACTKNACNSPKAICCNIYAHKINLNVYPECDESLLKLDKTDHKYLQCNKITSSNSNIIFGSFCGTLLCDMQTLYKTAIDELCFFVGCLGNDEKVVWINIVKTGVSYYSLGDLGYAVNVDKKGNVIAAFTTTGECEIIDCMNNNNTKLCADGVLGVCFSRSGKLLWNCDYGSGWASPIHIFSDNKYVILSVANNRDFECGCEGKEMQKFEFADIEYSINL